jgi:hypothetical protein
MVSEIRVPSSSNSNSRSEWSNARICRKVGHTNGDWLDLHTLLDVGGGRVI